ncbi:MAG: hypothetical protein KGL75_10670 [Acidobacteriota bacterium]|nr:hypothetical protein [Acidobacteriota bacterium]
MNWRTACTVFFIPAIATLLISGCGNSPPYPTKEDTIPAGSTANTSGSGLSYPTKEYLLTTNALAADSIGDFATLADAAMHQDTTGVLSLEAQGKAYMLAPGTRLIAGTITSGICGGTVESGEFISKDIVLACAQLGQ